MPRDLAAMRDQILNGMPELQKSSATLDPAQTEKGSSNYEPKDKISRDMDKQDHLAKIKPYTKSLTISDVGSCLELEEATFPPEERCTKEKVRMVKRCITAWQPTSCMRSSDHVLPHIPCSSSCLSVH